MNHRLLGFLLIILLLVVVFASGTVVYQIEQTKFSNETTTGYQPLRNPRLGIPMEEGPNAAYDPHCFKPKTATDADLCAQWSSVEAAEQANRLASEQIKLSALEFGALVLSLIFTGWAAFAAARAAKIAEDATRDAERALGIAEKNAQAAADLVKISADQAQRELRAYVTVKEFTLKNLKPNERVSAVVLLANVGRTPAFRFIGLSGLAVRESIGKFTVPEPPIDDFSTSVLGPTQDFQLRSDSEVAISQEDYEGIVSGRLAVYVFGRIRYEDVFGASRFVDFAAQTFGAADGAFRPSTFGNDAN